MSGNFSKSHPLQEGLKIMNQCPVCQGQYSESEAQILEEQAGANLIHITCPHCHNCILAVVVVSSFGMSLVGMATDLTADDVRRLRAKQPVSEDELLGFYNLLKYKQFNFKNL